MSLYPYFLCLISVVSPNMKGLSDRETKRGVGVQNNEEIYLFQKSTNTHTTEYRNHNTLTWTL